MASVQEMLLARVELVEARLASEQCSDAEKEALQPKLVQMRTALDEINKLYETRFAEIQERNKQAISDLQKLSARVERRASAAAAEKEAAEAKAKAEAVAKEEAAAKKTTKAKKSKKSPRGKKTSQLVATEEDTALLLAAVSHAPVNVASTPVLETPFVWPTAPIEFKPVVVAESPYVQCATPECWDAHSHIGSIILTAC